MRVVGLLLISALMIVPNATAQLLGRSFRASVRWAVLVGVASAWAASSSFYAETPSGGTIVLLAIAAFVAAAVGTAVAARVRPTSTVARTATSHEHGADCGHEAVPHGDHVDYLHDGHRTPPTRATTTSTATTATAARRSAHPRRPAPMTDTRSSPHRDRPAPTRQRAAVAAVLADIEEFRSAQRLHAQLRDAGEKVGLATVYRTLQAMAADGRSTCCAPTRARRSTARAAPDTTTTSSAAGAAGRSRWRVPSSSAGRTRSARSTASPTSRTPWRSSAPAPTAPAPPGRSPGRVKRR